MMDGKVRMGNKLLGEIQEFLEDSGIDNAEHEAHKVMHIIARNKVD